jgi:hypothetical protein
LPMPPRCLPKPSRNSCSRTPSMPMLLRPGDCRAPDPFFRLYVSVRAAWPCK